MLLEEDRRKQEEIQHLKEQVYQRDQLISALLTDNMTAFTLPPVGQENVVPAPEGATWLA